MRALPEFILETSHQNLSVPPNQLRLSISSGEMKCNHGFDHSGYSRIWLWIFLIQTNLNPAFSVVPQTRRGWLRLQSTDTRNTQPKGILPHNPFNIVESTGIFTKSKKRSRVENLQNNVWAGSSTTTAGGSSSVRRRWNPFRAKSRINTKKVDLKDVLETTPIQAVSILNSTVLPPHVIRDAVWRSNILGNPIKRGAIECIVCNLQEWYQENGYVLNRVAGASLKTGTATIEIVVDEPRIATVPIDVKVCKEMVVDDEDGGLLTLRQYRQKYEPREGFLHRHRDRAALNMTYTETPGRTQPLKLARAMSLKPGKPFQWRNDKWGKIANSGIFSKILFAQPQQLNDGTIQMQIQAVESPTRQLEYGVGKNLYTGSWEGEVDFEEQNIFGGGEVLGLVLRRGKENVEPSIRLRYSDERFGLGGGFDFEFFNDFLGSSTGTKKRQNEQNDGKPETYRTTGCTFRLRNPISEHFVRNSLSSTSLERTSTVGGMRESIGSTTLTLGPFKTYLPFRGRSSIVSSLTGGIRLAKNAIWESSLLPYTTVSTTTSQIFPIPTTRIGSRAPTLALQHSATVSSNNIPHHEAKAIATGCRIRGCGPDDVAISSLKGTVELRLPITTRFAVLEESAVVVFGDWYRTQSSPWNAFSGKCSFGVGFRNSIQGIPLKCDVCYTSEGNVKTLFGISRDFDI